MGTDGFRPLPRRWFERQVVGDREQPGRELGPRPVALAGLVDPQEDLLAQVLGLLEAADQVEEDADEPVLIPLDQGLERPRDVVADLEHEPDVGVAGLQLPFQCIELATAHGGTLRVDGHPRRHDRGLRHSSEVRAPQETSAITADPSAGSAVAAVGPAGGGAGRRPRRWPGPWSCGRVTLTPRPRRRRHEPADRLGRRAARTAGPATGLYGIRLTCALRPWSSRARAWASSEPVVDAAEQHVLVGHLPAGASGNRRRPPRAPHPGRPSR